MSGLRIIYTRKDMPEGPLDYVYKRGAERVGYVYKRKARGPDGLVREYKRTEGVVERRYRR